MVQKGLRLWSVRVCWPRYYHTYTGCAENIIIGPTIIVAILIYIYIYINTNTNIFVRHTILILVNCPS